MGSGRSSTIGNDWPCMLESEISQRDVASLCRPTRSQEMLLVFVASITSIDGVDRLSYVGRSVKLTHPHQPALASPLRHCAGCVLGISSLVTSRQPFFLVVGSEVIIVDRVSLGLFSEWACVLLVLSIVWNIIHFRQQGRIKDKSGSQRAILSFPPRSRNRRAQQARERHS